MKKLIASLVSAAILLTCLAGCNGSQSGSASSGGAPNSAAPSGTKERVDIELLGSSGTSYQVAVGVADIISNADNGYRMSATGTTNTAANIIAMREKDPTKAIYKSIEDLDGKSVGWDAEAIHTEHFRKVCEILGINVDIKCLGFTDKYEALSDGLVDAVYANFTGPSGTVMTPVTYLQEILLTDEVYPISFPAELQAQAAEMLDATWPYTATVAAEGTIEGQFFLDFRFTVFIKVDICLK